MRVDRSPYMNEERFVTVVDAKKFLHLWSLEPYNFNAELGKGTRKTWVADRKYPEAAKGFSHGISNPVPLANVVCNEHQDQSITYKKRLFRRPEIVKIEEVRFSYVNFINGITRTIWLLANGAQYFPVECHSKNGAERLFYECGLESCPIKSVEELTIST